MYWNLLTYLLHFWCENHMNFDLYFNKIVKRMLAKLVLICCLQLIKIKTHKQQKEYLHMLLKGNLKLKWGWRGLRNRGFDILDVMECFLHTLRLHWVEFQNKFFKGTCYRFATYSLTEIIQSKEGDKTEYSKS